MKQFIIILSIFLAGFLSASGVSLKKQKKIDSLKSVIEGAHFLGKELHGDTTVCDAYLDWGEMIYMYNPDTALVLWKESHRIAKKQLDANPSPDLEKKYLHLLADALNNIGYIFKQRGDIAKGLDYYQRSFEILEKLGDKRGLATAMNNIGGIYFDQGLDEKGMEYYLKCLEIRREVGTKSGEALALNNLGAIYKNRGEMDKALEYYRAGLIIYREIGKKSGIAITLNNIGSVYYKEGTGDFGMKNYQESYKIREEMGSKSGMARTLHNISTVYYRLNDMASAKEYGIKSMALAEEIGYPELIRTGAKFLSKVYKRQGRFESSLEMYKLYIQMRDSIRNRATQKAAILQQTRYEYEKKHLADSLESAKEFELKDLKISEQKAQLKQSRTQQIALTGGGILFLILAIVAFVSYRTKQRDNEVISAQKLDVEREKEEADHQKEIVEEKNKEITDSINYAKRIQMAILPTDALLTENLPESFVLYKPKDIVAGDFYWMNVFDNNVIFASADCTGHGVPGAMLSMLCNNALNRSVREYALREPGEILDRARELVIAEFEKSGEDIRDGMDISLCSLQGNVLKFAGAYNPVWIIREGELTETRGDKQPIGVADTVVNYTTHTFKLQKGDIFYIFSDGYVDQFGGIKGKKFKSKAFKELLVSLHDKSMEEQKNIINQTFEDWKGKLDQIDDVCVIGVRV